MSLRSYLYNKKTDDNIEQYTVYKVIDANRGTFRTAKSLIGCSINEINKTFIDVPSLTLNIINGTLQSCNFNTDTSSQIL